MTQPAPSTTTTHTSSHHTNNDVGADAAIQRFKRYIQFRTITEEMPHTGVNYECLKCVIEVITSTNNNTDTATSTSHNSNHSDNNNIQVRILEYTSKRPILLATWY